MANDRGSSTSGLSRAFPNDSSESFGNESLLAATGEIDESRTTSLGALSAQTSGGFCRFAPQMSGLWESDAKDGSNTLRVCDEVTISAFDSGWPFRVSERIYEFVRKHCHARAF